MGFWAVTHTHKYAQSNVRLRELLGLVRHISFTLHIKYRWCRQINVRLSFASFFCSLKHVHLRTETWHTTGQYVLTACGRWATKIGANIFAPSRFRLVDLLVYCVIHLLSTLFLFHLLLPLSLSLYIGFLLHLIIVIIVVVDFFLFLFIACIYLFSQSLSVLCTAIRIKQNVFCCFSLSSLSSSFSLFRSRSRLFKFS